MNGAAGKTREPKKKENAGNKWNDEPPSEQELKKRFTSSLTNKISYVLQP
ncbi:hypothetical protein RvY_02120 [Ramazzottius varieornatus]|uniref:Uncharacterized protein n=1 Tax=Ramazzottius varieornatus TaxID=947166 RepID=A0A1D1UME4_RAMVA|nr:hypothetical protein RvY_02120 [Ramazzottius varieornatus]